MEKKRLVEKDPALKKDDLIVITGGGGFIAGNLALYFKNKGFTNIRAVDKKPLYEWYLQIPGVQSLSLDCSQENNCHRICEGAVEVYNLAADMGGMGFIESHKADCMLSVLINTHLLLAARDAGVGRYLFASSACVYNGERQSSPDVTALREEDAYPALPEDGYGWEKLFGERMCRHFHEDYGLEVRVPRLHNVYGPHGTYDGGREKAPAAICRKVVEAELSGSGAIEIWGDGLQTRSFTYVDDTVEGLLRLMESDVREPLNLGSSQLITINRLVDIVEAIAEVRLERSHVLDAPLGVRGRNSDNTRIVSLLGWEPSIPIEEGLVPTYAWIRAEMVRSGRYAPVTG